VDFESFGEWQVRQALYPDGHNSLIATMKKLRPKCIIMEATGVYYFDLAVALVEAGLPVAVIPPKSTKNFANIKLQNSKTDSIDAALLAEYGMRMEPRLWTPPDQHRQALRSLGRQINRLTGSQTQAKNRLHAMKAAQSTPTLLVEDEQEAIEMLGRRIERLKQAAMTLLRQSPELKRLYRHFCAAKGIAQATAPAFLAELRVLPDHLKFAHRSAVVPGWIYACTSLEAAFIRPRISKAGNAHIRSALYMPAMSAVRFDPNAKAFYETLVARRKTKLQAQVAVMRNT
jgi:transposase|tara:strand:- start:881 stop:1741 length:861 start_codon:yes stop_codon:yes gene_type:complete